MFVCEVVPAIICILLHFSSAQTHDEVVVIQEATFSKYTKQIRPVFDQTSPIGLDITFHLMAINDFDEVKGTLKLLGFFSLRWTDDFSAWGFMADILRLKVQSYSLTIPNSMIWLPKLVLGNPSDKFTEITDTKSKVRVSSTGLVEWTPGGLYQVACSVDTSFFPFDDQTCSMDIMVWDYTSSEVYFQNAIDFIDTYYYEEHPVWELSEAPASINKTSGSSRVIFTLHLTRRPTYFVVNILTPVLLLGTLNTLVFMLPVDSGERVGFSVAMFLSFVIFMTMVGDNLPRNSDPLSLLSFFLITMLSISALEIVLTIAVLKIHHKPESDPIPEWLATAAYGLLCMCCRKSKVQSFTDKQIAYIHQNSVEIGSEASISRQELFSIKITWKKIAKICDWMFFFLCIGLHIFVTISFIVPLALRFSF